MDNLGQVLAILAPARSAGKPLQAGFAAMCCRAIGTDDPPTLAPRSV
jgi:hypothetical protein